MTNESSARRLGTAGERWAAVGPYYAMFPISFAFDVIEAHSQPGGAVLDPFAGRGSSIYAASQLGRLGWGIEIHPVGWIYARAKLEPADRRNVLRRIAELEELALAIPPPVVGALPGFFHVCYAPRVLRFLLAARSHLRWKHSVVDRTLVALLLIHLHGKRSSSLSNQMRQGKAMSPDYSVRWWQDNQSLPPDIDPAAFLVDRVEWRYLKGKPRGSKAYMTLGDSTRALQRAGTSITERLNRKFDLLFTSPPYYGITNYHYDQWLRLWLLGGPERPGGPRDQWAGKFESREAYQSLLQSVFTYAAALLSPAATVYVRTDARPFTLETTKNVLSAVFPSKSMRAEPRPYVRSTQTALFGDDGAKPGEVDLILS